MLEGTITSALTFYQSGTSGHVITLKFDTGAVMSAPYWPTYGSGGAINIGNNSYITVDGGATGSIGGVGATGTTNGVIQCTANGTNLANQINSCGIFIQGNYVTVKNLVISNIYVNVPPNDTNEYGDGVMFMPNSGSGPSYGTVTNCVIHDVASPFWVTYGTGASNLSMTYCTTYDLDKNAVGDSGAGATLSGLTVDHNYIYGWANWEDTPDENHHNGFFTWANFGGTASGVVYSNNTIGPGFTGAHQSSALFTQGLVSSRIYNNLVICSNGQYAADGLIYVDASRGTLTTPQTVGIFNNTIIGGAMPMVLA